MTNMEEGAIIQLNPAMRIVASLASALLCTATAASAQTAGDLKLQPAAIVARAAALVNGAELAYVSDYLSFAGEDGEGRVAFALDTNRGVAGDEHQAEHFAVLYDSREGWIDLDGSTDFPNERGALLDYPDSPYFVFSGEPYAISVSHPQEDTVLVGNAGKINETTFDYFMTPMAFSTIIRTERIISMHVLEKCSILQVR